MSWDASRFNAHSHAGTVSLAEFDALIDAIDEGAPDWRVHLAMACAKRGFTFGVYAEGDGRVQFYRKTAHLASPFKRPHDEKPHQVIYAGDGFGFCGYVTRIARAP